MQYFLAPQLYFTWVAIHKDKKWVPETQVLHVQVCSFRMTNRPSKPYRVDELCYGEHSLRTKLAVFLK